MVCTCDKSSVLAYNTNAQTVSAGGTILFPTSQVTGCKINYAGSTNPAQSGCHGLYYVDVSANILGTTAGNVTVQLLNNGQPVNGALATITVADGSNYNVAFSTLIKVNRCVLTNTLNLSVQLLTTDATVESATISVIKVG